MQTQQHAQNLYQINGYRNRWTSRVFSISKTKSISYHPTQSYYEIDFHICLYSVAIQKESMQIKTCYNSIWSVYMKTYFSFGVFIYIYIFLWEHLICIMSTAVFVFGVAYAVMQLFFRNIEYANKNAKRPFPILVVQISAFVILQKRLQ